MDGIKAQFEGLWSSEKAHTGAGYTALSLGDLSADNSPSQSASDTDAGLRFVEERPAKTRYRLITQIVVPSFVLLAILWLVHPTASAYLSSPSFVSQFAQRLHGQPQTRVGPRTTYNHYYGRGCNTTELLRAVARARIRPDGASRGNSTAPTGNEFDLDAFEFSYDLDGCPPPHVFRPAEACDLVNSFGGIRTQGDSLMRQFAQGLFMALTGSLDLVEPEWQEHCRGNKLFTEGRECKFHSIFDTRLMQNVCPGAEQPFVQYDQVWRFISESTNPTLLGAHWDYNASQPTIDTYNEFVQSLPAKRRAYSPIFVNGVGIHYKFNLEPSQNGHIMPFLRNVFGTVPQPLKFWSGYPAPGANKPPEHMKSQGPELVKAYTAEMTDLLGELSPGEASLGAWTMMDWFNSTDGANSFDGTHFDYQVAQERAQIFFNMLDILWGEIVAQGGLVEDADAEERVEQKVPFVAEDTAAQEELEQSLRGDEAKPPVPPAAEPQAPAAAIIADNVGSREGDGVESPEDASVRGEEAGEGEAPGAGRGRRHRPRRAHK